MGTIRTARAHRQPHAPLQYDDQGRATACRQRFSRTLTTSAATQTAPFPYAYGSCCEKRAPCAVKTTWAASSRTAPRRSSRPGGVQMPCRKVRISSVANRTGILTLAWTMRNRLPRIATAYTSLTLFENAVSGPSRFSTAARGCRYRACSISWPLFRRVVCHGTMLRQTGEAWPTHADNRPAGGPPVDACEASTGRPASRPAVTARTTPSHPTARSLHHLEQTFHGRRSHLGRHAPFHTAVSAGCTHATHAVAATAGWLGSIVRGEPRLHHRHPLLVRSYLKPHFPSWHEKQCIGTTDTAATGDSPWSHTRASHRCVATAVDTSAAPPVQPRIKPCSPAQSPPASCLSAGRTTLLCSLSARPSARAAFSTTPTRSSPMTPPGTQPRQKRQWTAR